MAGQQLQFNAGFGLGPRLGWNLYTIIQLFMLQGEARGAETMVRKADLLVQFLWCAFLTVHDRSVSRSSDDFWIG